MNDDGFVKVDCTKNRERREGEREEKAKKTTKQRILSHAGISCFTDFAKLKILRPRAAIAIFSPSPFDVVVDGFDRALRHWKSFFSFLSIRSPNSRGVHKVCRFADDEEEEMGKDEFEQKLNSQF